MNTQLVDQPLKIKIEKYWYITGELDIFGMLKRKYWEKAIPLEKPRAKYFTNEELIPTDKGR